MTLVPTSDKTSCNDTCMHLTQKKHHTMTHVPTTHKTSCNYTCTHLTQNKYYVMTNVPTSHKTLLYNDKCTHFAQNKYYTMTNAPTSQSHKTNTMHLSLHLQRIWKNGFVTWSYPNIWKVLQSCSHTGHSSQHPRSVCVCVCNWWSHNEQVSREKVGCDRKRTWQRRWTEKESVCVRITVCVCMCVWLWCVCAHSRAYMLNCRIACRLQVTMLVTLWQTIEKLKVKPLKKNCTRSLFKLQDYRRDGKVAN